jgi:hypothetical protein
MAEVVSGELAVEFDPNQFASSVSHLTSPAVLPIGEFGMPAEGLLQACNRMRREGADFPSIWRELIEPHRLVLGHPVGDHEDGKPILWVRLETGQRLVFRDTEYGLEWLIDVR